VTNSIAGSTRPPLIFERCSKRSSDIVVGDVFGRLTVVGLVTTGRSGKRVCECRCACGAQRAFVATDLGKRIFSCGCKSRDCTKTRCLTHGLSKTREYRIWASIKQRCTNPARSSYQNYGGRGITLHPEWADSFESFLTYVGKAPSPKFEIDRIDNHLGYQPGNVRWVTRTQNARNRRDSKKACVRGITLTLREWSELINVSFWTLRGRYDNGRDLGIESALPDSFWESRI
jgi:hypothetical protein